MVTAGDDRQRIPALIFVALSVTLFSERLTTMTNWFYTDAFGTRMGPLDDQQIRQLVGQEIITPETPMETDTGHTGVAGQIPGLFAAVSAPFAQAAQVYCTHCGNSVPEHAVVCPQCGAAVHARHARYASAGYAGGPPVYDYLIWSIITTLCCCVPLGIPAIIFSVNCRGDLAAGRYESAVKNSKTAFWCNLVGLLGGFVLVVLNILFNILFVILGAMGEGV